MNSTLPPKFSPKTNFCAKELVFMDVCQSERCEAAWMSVCIHVCLCMCVCVYDFKSDFKRICLMAFLQDK